MKVKLGYLRGAEESVRKLMTTDLPIKLSYLLSKMVKVISDELINIEEVRHKLVKKYGEEGENENFEVKPENVLSFTKEFDEFLGTDVELFVTPIKLNDIPSDVRLSAVDMNMLTGFIVDEEEAISPSS